MRALFPPSILRRKFTSSKKTFEAAVNFSFQIASSLFLGECAGIRISLTTGDAAFAMVKSVQLNTAVVDIFTLINGRHFSPLTFFDVFGFIAANNF